MSTVDHSVFGSFKGEPIIDSSELRLTQFEGISVLGTTSILITDYPAAYVHDSGGLLVAKKLIRIESNFENAVAIRFKRIPRQSHAQVTIDIEASPTCRLSSLVSIEDKGRTSHMIKKLWKFGHAVAPTRAAQLYTPVALPSEWALKPRSASSTSEEDVYLCVQEGTLRAHILFDERASVRAKAMWPLNSVSLHASGDRFLNIDGTPKWQPKASKKDAHEVRIAFPSSSKRNEFLTAAQALARGDAKNAEGAVAAVRAAPKGTEVDVDGPHFGGVRRFKANLTDSELALQDDGKIIAKIAFDDTKLRVSGTADRLVLFTPNLGPVGMQFGVGQSKRAVQLLENSDILAAAKRTVSDGPYPVLFNHSSPVKDVRSRDVHASLAKVEAGNLNLTSAEGIRDIPLSELSMLCPTFEHGAWLEIETDDQTKTVAVTATPQVLEALHSDIRAGSLALAPLDRLPAYLKAAAALEEDYFLDAIFGPCFELHAALVSPEWTAKGVADLTKALEIPKAESADTERSRLAALLSGGLDELRQHFDRVTHMLPPLVRHLDERLAVGDEGVGPKWLKQQEAGLRRVLSVTGRAGAEITQLCAQAEQISGFDPSRVKEGYGGTALAIGAGILINPLFLISGASQAYSQHQSGEQRRADISGQALGMLHNLASRWNIFVTGLVPMLSYTLTEALYPQRVLTAANLAGTLTKEKLSEDARADGFRRVAKRLARLDIRRRYPVAPISVPATSEGLSPLTRGAMIDHIKALRDGLEIHRFSTF